MVFWIYTVIGYESSILHLPTNVTFAFVKYETGTHVGGEKKTDVFLSKNKCLMIDKKEVVIVLGYMLRKYRSNAILLKYSIF